MVPGQQTLHLDHEIWLPEGAAGVAGIRRMMALIICKIEAKYEQLMDILVRYNKIEICELINCLTEMAAAREGGFSSAGSWILWHTIPSMGAA